MLLNKFHGRLVPVSQDPDVWGYWGTTAKSSSLYSNLDEAILAVIRHHRRSNGPHPA